jgi:hypothetical protein
MSFNSDWNFSSSPPRPEGAGLSTPIPTAPRGPPMDPSSSPAPHGNSSVSQGGPMPGIPIRSPPVTPILSPLVVDTVARDFGLEPKQLQLLRAFVGVRQTHHLCANYF